VNGSVNIARSKYNRYTRRENILNGGNKQCLMLYEQDMNEEAYCNGSGTDLWIRSDRIWYPELQMRSANVWDMTLASFICLLYTCTLRALLSHASRDHHVSLSHMHCDNIVPTGRIEPYFHIGLNS
jgi:hypothetical protein